MKVIKLVSAVCLTVVLQAGSASAQLKWPAVTKETKPWTRWWWEGSAVNKTDLSYLLETYQKNGLGGVEITSIYGVKGHENEFIDFLSPKWIEMVSHTLKESSRLGMGVDLAQASGWPFGGPWVGPDDAAKYITYKSYTIKAGESLQEPVVFTQLPIIRTNGQRVDLATLKEPVASNPNLQLMALDQVRFPKPIPLQVLMAYSDNGAQLDLTSKVDADGKLNWTAPAGNWTLYATFMGWHGKMVERASPGGEGLAIDHFSQKAASNYLSHFDKVFAGYDLKSLRAFFNDSYEVDDASGQSNWTPLFFDEFKTAQGYDLRTQLPALFGKDTPEKNDRVLCDYRETISNLLLKNYTQLWHSWASKRGALIRNQAHGSPANILDLYAATDIPETEGTDIMRLKFASSAAHVTGKKLTSSESATWQNEHFLSTLADIKKALDLYLLGGVNHVFYHGTNYSPKDAPWPGWLFYAAVHFEPSNPFYDHFAALNQYVTRCQSFLQPGKPDNDLLLYYPIYDELSSPARGMVQHFDGIGPFFNGSSFKSGAEMLNEHGYSFDFISDKQVLNLGVLNKGLNTGGVSYKTIVLPEPRYMPLSTLKKLLELAKRGATVVFYKNLPADVPGFGRLEVRRTEFRSLINSLKFADTGKGARKASVGAGVVLLGDDLDLLLNYARIYPEAMGKTGLQFIRRKNDQGTAYFITNRTGKAIFKSVPIQATATSVAVFNPMTGQMGKAIFKKVNGATEVYIGLRPSESIIIQTYKTDVVADRYPYYVDSPDLQQSASAIALNGKWNVSFIKGGPVLPETRELTQLGSWTNFGGDDVKKFSGTARYSTSFAKPSRTDIPWMLNLGRVAESAMVKLNGKELGTLIGPNYDLTILPGLWKDVNVLEIEVANLMINRIIDMDKNKIPYRIFYNTNFPARLPTNRGEDGLFTAANMKEKESGLIGPVSLSPMK